MKQIKDLAWMSAIALAGTITFAACSSDDDKVQNINPTYDGKSVKTQFAINIPRAAQQTRQTEEITQNNSDFRGMQDIVLFSSTESPTETTPLNKIELSNFDQLEYNSVHKVYNDVVVPVGTKNFLFYGQALKATGDYSSAANGELKATYPTTTVNGNGISFALNKINDGSGIAYQNDADATALLNIINGIVTVEGWSTTEDTSLKNAYDNFILLNAGSAYSILKAVQKVYDVVKDAEEGVALSLKNKIKDYFTADNEKILSYTSLTNSNYPENLGLPQGVARLTFDANNTSNTPFRYTTSSVIGNGITMDPTTICYPAALYYYANTPLKANNNANITWPTTLDAWTSGFENWDTYVKPTTQTIALQYSINYGVALLKTTVKTSSTSLSDNSKLLGNTASDKIITVNNTTFPVTGILVGSQPASVDWEFNPKGDKDCTIYDNVMNETIHATSGNSTANYTMVLDNNATSNPQDEVNIAIELQNKSSEEFYGADGLVPVGGKFYLVAKLDPNTNNNNDVNRVFLKDYVTDVTLTVSSLKNAYVTIPDLRSTKLQLGLAVDLSWEAGLTFDVTIE